MNTNDCEKAYDILKNYTGTNNQILYYCYKVKNTSYALGDFDVTYILNNHDFQSYDVNKIVKISSDFGEIMMKKYNLEFKPEKIYIGRVIGEMGESLHCYVQYRKSVKPTLMYVRKHYILNNLIDKTSEITLNIDFDKYDKITLERDGTTLKQAQKEGIEFLLKKRVIMLMSVILTTS